MTEIFCDKCGKKLDYWKYHKYNAIYDVDVVWHEPHQSNENGIKTLLYFLPPGDIHMNLCEDCGKEIHGIIKDWLKNKEDTNEGS